MNENSKQVANTNPIFSPIVECYGRSALSGLAAFWFVFSTTHFLQKPLKNRIGYPVTSSLIISTALAAAATYQITNKYLAKCSEISENKKEN